MGPDKVAAAYTFVTRTIKESQKENLNKLINDNPGLELELMGHLVGEYKTNVSISVGKSKTSASKSTKTR